MYLLHFSEPYRHAAHYIGWTPGELEKRLRSHQSGRGARLLEVITNAGITFKLARTWSGSRRDERAKKRQGGAGMLCPICRDAGIHRRSRRFGPKEAAMTPSAVDSAHIPSHQNGNLVFYQQSSRL